MAGFAFKSTKTLRWALGLSLGVNLLVLGLVAGAVYRFDGPHGGAMRHMRDYGTPYVMALPEERRRAVFVDARKGREDKSVSRAARRALYQEALTAIRAEPFDPAEARRVLDLQRDATLTVQQTVQNAGLAELAQMSAPERAAYADRVEEMLKRGKKGKRDGAKPPKAGQ